MTERARPPDSNSLHKGEADSSRLAFEQLSDDQESLLEFLKPYDLKKSSSSNRLQVH
jgi:hypothetical protein